MKIVQLNVENIKRLTAVSITPDGSTVIIGGLNGAGKSSVLDAIAMALGGQKLVPEEPIHTGAAEAKVEVDLGKFVVTRTFRRDKIDDDPQDHAPHGAFHWSPTRSTLVIKTKDGAQYGSPQKLLDELVGQLTFDPLAFRNMPETQQLETLRRLVGIDFTAVNRERADAYAARTAANAEAKLREVKLTTMPLNEGVPAETIDLSVISAEMHEASVVRQKLTEAERIVSGLEGQQIVLQQSHENIRGRVEALKKQLTDAEQEEKNILGKRSNANAELITAREAVQLITGAMPDMNAIQQRLSEVQATNDKVIANQRRTGIETELKAYKTKAADLTATIEACDHKKADMITEAKWPLPGLGFNDTGVLLNGLPFKQASTAEQLRTSVAVGLAVNPNFKVLLIKSGNDLDSHSLKAIAEQAAAADAQLWIERVAETKDGVSVLIEDGHVVA